MAISAQQLWGNPASQKAAGSLYKKFAPKVTQQIGGKSVTSIRPGFKPVGGMAGFGIGIGADILGSKLKPKEDQPLMGGEFGHITDAYKRRQEGAGPGILGGAIRGAGQGTSFGPWGMLAGAGVGAATGAFSKNATTAYSDFNPNDARGAITKAYQQYLGRPPEEGAVEGWMRGQGWKPGDKGVGQYALFEKLKEIKNSEEAQGRSGINTGPSPTAMSNYRTGPINIPSYFTQNPEGQELARRINARAGF